MAFGDENDGDFMDQTEPARRSVMAVVWQRKALVVLGTLVGLVVGFLFYWQRAPVYQSTAQILVIKKRSDPLPVAGGDPRLGYVEDYMATHLALLRSPLIIERAVTEEGLGFAQNIPRQRRPRRSGARFVDGGT